MKNPQLSLIFSLSVILLFSSCSPSLNSQPTSVPISPTPIPTNQGQRLPISAKAKMGSEIIELEVAQTPEQQTIGLMYRSELSKNRGMLFPFSPERVARFWMKNMAISLDMIFLKDEVIKAIFADVPPCKLDPCPVYGPSLPINQVIEIPAGRAKELGLKEGDQVYLEFFYTP